MGIELLLIVTRNADELLSDINIDDLDKPWTPKIRGFSDLFCDFWLQE